MKDPAPSLARCSGGRHRMQSKPTPTLSQRGQLVLQKLPMANSSKVRVVEFLPRAFVTVRVTLYFTVEKSWRYLMWHLFLGKTSFSQTISLVPCLESRGKSCY